MNDTWRETFYKVALATFIGAVFLWLVYISRAVIFPFITAFFVAYLLDPVIDKMETYKINRSAAIFILLLVVFGFFMTLLILVAPILMDQVEALGRNLPGYIDKLGEKIAPLAQYLPDLGQGDIRTRLAEAMGMLGDLPAKALKSVASGLWAGLSGAMGVLIAMFNLVMIPVASFYMLKDYDVIVEKISGRIPPRHKGKALEIMGKIDTALSGFIRGQLLVALFMAFTLGTGLMLIGVPGGLFIGIVAGVSNIVPYLPIIVGLAPAVLLAYLGFGDITHMVMVATLFAVAQTIEGFYITPRTMEKAVGLHPLAVMAALLAGGVFFGFVGVALAVPVAAVLKIALLELDKVYLTSQVFGRSDQEN